MTAWALVIGIPLGLIAGRLAWRTVSQSLGTLAAPGITDAAGAATIGLFLIAVAAVTTFPAYAASRIRRTTELHHD